MATKFLIRTPQNIPSDMKHSIKEQYEDAVKNSGKAEEDYVKEKFSEWKKCLEKKRGYKKKLVVACDLLYKTYFEIGGNSIIISHKAKKEVIVALYYAVNPFDLIPDFTPETGYLDDVYCINYCLTKLRTSAPVLYEKIESLLEGI